MTDDHKECAAGPMIAADIHAARGDAAAFAGKRVYVIDEGREYVHDGNEWVEAPQESA